VHSMSSGLLFEDFVPVSDTHALITTGLVLDRLTRIELAQYAVKDGRVAVNSVLGGVLVCDGGHHRLGHVHSNTSKAFHLVYSNGNGIVGADVESKTAHQPFVYGCHVYYTDDWPNVRIYKDGEVFLDHFERYCQVGNPHWGADGMMYFEARKDADPQRPEAWEVWRYNPRAQMRRRVCQGANPAYYKGRLFWGEWNGRGFSYRCTRVD